MASVTHAQTLADTSRSASLTLEGFVFTTDGAPAPGAVVTTSGGGRALCDEDGHYRLELAISSRAVAIEVRASRDGHEAQRLVEGIGSGAGVWSAPLVLAPPTPGAPRWRTTFGGEPGVSDDVFATAIFDDGSGVAVYAGGRFVSAGGNGQCMAIGRWDGERWAGLDGGMNGDVNALQTFDEGSGEALYAGGTFTRAGGQAASRVARWDGTSWAPLGAGLDGPVHALASFDDGGGPALIAAGSFELSGATAVTHVARWNGTTWQPLGAGLNDEVHALATFDEGNGPALFAGGCFTVAGGVPASTIARWDGSVWTPVGTGITGVLLIEGCSVTPTVAALAVFDDGGGPALYATGAFQAAGGVAASSIARWDGGAWSPLGNGLGCPTCFLDWGGRVLRVFDDGSGPALFVGGDFQTAGGGTADHLARWNGVAWSGVGTTLGNNFSSVRALSAVDLGQGPALVVGGSFDEAGTEKAHNIALWDAAGWTRMGGYGPDSNVEALAVHDDGTGSALYVGGYLSEVDDTAVGKIARWDGKQWSTLDGGIDAPTWGYVNEMRSHDDGTGPALYVAGAFSSIGGVAASNIARWRGAHWEPVGGGMNNTVRTLVSFDDGSGTKLHAGGNFTAAGGSPAYHFARWDGSSWAAISPPMNGEIQTLAVFDDGSGPALYAGGSGIEVGGTNLRAIVKLDGGAWSTVGGGVDLPNNGAVEALAVLDDGSGPALYAGGSFSRIGGVQANRVARWDGSAWSPLGGGLTNVGGTGINGMTLLVHDDGRGPALFAGGSFATAGGNVALKIARWDGSSWSALGGGMDGYVTALCTFDAGDGPSLFAGGAFESCVDSGDSYLARWGRVPVSPVSPAPASWPRAAAPRLVR